MVMKPESSSRSQQSVHSQATLSSNTHTAGDTVPVTHLGLVRLLGGSVHLSHHIAQHQQKRKKDSMFQYQHKEMGHKHFTPKHLNMQFLGTQQRGGGPARVGEALARLLTTLCHPCCLPGTGPGGCRHPAAPACEQRRGEGHRRGGHPARVCVLHFHAPPES